MEGPTPAAEQSPGSLGVKCVSGRYKISFPSPEGWSSVGTGYPGRDQHPASDSMWPKEVLCQISSKDLQKAFTPGLPKFCGGVKESFPYTAHPYYLLC